MSAGHDPAAERAAPVFVTRFSMAKKTALGVLTRQFFDGVPGARHLYWEDVEIGRPPANVLRLEAPIAARFAPFKRAGRARDIADLLRIRRWRTTLPDDLAERVRRLRDSTSVVYLAPMGGVDAARMREIVALLDRPFVLHVWDMLDGDASANPDLAWLAAHASRIFPLTREIGAALGVPDAPLLPFVRADTPLRAAPPVPGEPLRIGLMGDLGSYADGVGALVAADELLRARGIAVRWRYVGREKVLRRLPMLAGRVTATGFLADDAARDRTLADWHMAFMPGPKRAPEDDLRSRFSVPSRTLDFGAVGLPVVGVVHPRSAAAGLAHELAPTMCAPDAAALAATIERLAAPAAWQAAAHGSRAFFERIDAMRPVATLAAELGAFAVRENPATDR